MLNIFIPNKILPSAAKPTLQQRATGGGITDGRPNSLTNSRAMVHKKTRTEALVSRGRVAIVIVRTGILGWGRGQEDNDDTTTRATRLVWAASLSTAQPENQDVNGFSESTQTLWKQERFNEQQHHTGNLRIQISVWGFHGISPLQKQNMTRHGELER